MAAATYEIIEPEPVEPDVRVTLTLTGTEAQYVLAVLGESNQHVILREAGAESDVWGTTVFDTLRNAVEAAGLNDMRFQGAACDYLANRAYPGVDY